MCTLAGHLEVCIESSVGVTVRLMDKRGLPPCPHGSLLRAFVGHLSCGLRNQIATVKSLWQTRNAAGTMAEELPPRSIIPPLA